MAELAGLQILKVYPIRKSILWFSLFLRVFLSGYLLIGAGAKPNKAVYCPSMTDSLSALTAAVRDVRDFPKPGILFKDITPILSDGRLFRLAVRCFVEATAGLQARKVVGIDARGFLFGAAAAYELGIGFVPVRKKGKLPYRTESASYTLEYGQSVVEMHVDAIEPGERVVLIDDLLATGGTAAAAACLISKMGGVLTEAQFLIELEFLAGRTALKNLPVRSFLKY